MSLILGGSGGGGDNIDLSTPDFSITSANGYTIPSAAAVYNPNVASPPLEDTTSNTHWAITLFDLNSSTFKMWAFGNLPYNTDSLPDIGANYNSYMVPIGGWDKDGMMFSAFSDMSGSIDSYYPNNFNSFGVPVGYNGSQYSNPSFPFYPFANPPVITNDNILAAVDPTYGSNYSELRYFDNNNGPGELILSLFDIGYSSNWAIYGHFTPGYQNYSDFPPPTQYICTDMLFLVNQVDQIARLVEVDLYNGTLISESSDISTAGTDVILESAVVGSNFYDIGNGREGMTVLSFENPMSGTIDVFTTKSIHVREDPNS